MKQINTKLHDIKEWNKNENVYGWITSTLVDKNREWVKLMVCYFPATMRVHCTCTAHWHSQLRQIISRLI